MFKIYIKRYKYRSYVLRSSTIIREHVESLAKVIFLLKHSLKLHRYRLCGDVAACHRVACLLRVAYDDVNLRFRGPYIVSVFLLIYFQRDATLHSLFISEKFLYMFRVVSSPIIRSTYNCIYSTWYLLTITDICLYCGRGR